MAITYPHSQNAKLMALLFALALLALLPLLVVYPAGVARSGVSQGFLYVFDRPLYVALVACVGIWASWMKRDAVLLLPLSFVLMFCIGSFMVVNVALYPMVKMFMLGAVLLFALTVGLLPTRMFWLAASVCGSIAYQLGVSHSELYYSADLPLFLIIGEVLALLLVLAASISFGIIIKSLIPSLDDYANPPV